MTREHDDASRATAMLRLSALPRAAARPVDWRPEGAALEALAAAAGVRALRKVRLIGELIPEGRADWRLEAELGATAVQACVLTLADVTTRIDAPLLRLYRAEAGEPGEAQSGAETEMSPDADTVEPLPATLDLAALVAEALAIELPDYPRASGAELGAVLAGPLGAPPLTDEAARPFAGLADLRARLGNEGSDGAGGEGDDGDA